MNEIWILGATGRSGRAIALQLVKAQLSPVLVGRDSARLREVAAATGTELPMVVAGSVEAIAAELSRAKPAVVINTIGPFTETALLIAKACPPGTHYVDLSNELFSFLALFALQDQAVAAKQTFVTGVGFGVLATESVVLKLCEGQPPAEHVRVDAIPSVDIEAGLFGTALAATIIESAVAGGRQYVQGKLVHRPFFGEFETLRLPDGSAVSTSSSPTGDLEAARRASGAAYAVAASSMAPTAPVLRALLPTVMGVLKIPAVRNLAKRRMAAIKMVAKVREKEFSWSHARVKWSSGITREGWLRTGDAMTFTIATVVEVTRRLVHQEGQPGVFTPGALFGADLAIQAGGQFFLD
jgi:short subunit dehydrogenase-like uncharacterized protein